MLDYGWKRLLSGLLALVLVVGMLPPAAVWADEEETAPVTETTEVTEAPETTEVLETTEATEAQEATAPTEFEETQPEETEPEETVETEPAETEAEETLPEETREEIELYSETGIVASGTCGENLTWTLDEEGTLTISGTGDMDDYSRWWIDAPWDDCGEEIMSVAIKLGVTSIGTYAFCECDNLVNISIPESVERIGKGAFYRCKRLESIVIPGYVMEIEESTFESCTALANVTLPDGLQSIAKHAFSECESLYDITIPQSVTIIGDRAFCLCHSLTNISIPEGVTTIGDATFLCCENLTNVSIPEGVMTIGEKAFCSCNSLTNISIPESVTTIGEQAFRSCYGLTSITIPKSVTSIGEGIFAGGDIAISIAEGNTHYIVEDGFLLDANETILLYAPHDRTGTYTIPDSVVTIGYGAFERCGFSQINIPESVTTIGERAFWNSYAITSICIPKSVTTIGETAFTYTFSITEFVVDRNNPNYSSQDGFLLNKAGTFLIQAPIGKKLSVTVPDGVVTIGENAFSNSDGMTTVKIPEGVTTIEYEAFFGCTNLCYVVIPSTLTNVASGAFDECQTLTDVYYASTEEQWKQIDFGGWGNDSLLNATIHYGEGAPGYIASGSCGENLTWVLTEDGTLTISGTGDMDEDICGDALLYSCKNLITTVVIEPGVTSIRNYAFQLWDKLTSISIPESVTRIGEIVCCNCTSLTDVYYDGTKAQWNAIEIGYGNDELTNATIHCSDGIFEKVPVETLKIHPTDLIQLVSGQSQQLTAVDAEGNQVSVTWAITEGSDYATITNAGKLTAKTVAEKKTITVTATDSTGATGSKTITILPKATSVTIGEVETMVDMYEKSTLTLTATTAPEDALNDVTWTTSNKKIATVDDKGLVTLLKPGTVTITATANDGSKKSDKVTLTVYYVDTASKLTATTDVPTTGLQPGQTGTITVKGSTVLDNFQLEFTTSNSKITTVENGVITAQNVAGTATITAQIPGDPLNRKATVTVKVIERQVCSLILEPTLDDHAQRDDHNGESLVLLDARSVNSGTYSFTISAVASDYAGKPFAPNVTWVSNNTAIATVTDNKDGTATVTIKKGASGECAITATSKDAAKVSANLWVSVRDYAPRLENSSLSMNLYQTSNVEIGLAESYENSIAGVSIDGDFYVDWNEGTLAVTAQDDVTKGTYTQTLSVTCANGETYEYTLKIKVTETAPTVTIKQSGKYNLFYTDGTTTLTVTAKGATVENVTVTDGNFSGEYADGTLTLTCNGVANPSKKVTLEIQVAGYEKPVEKTVTLSTVTTAPKLKLSTTSSVINTALSTDPSTSFQIINSTTGEVLDPTGLVSCDSSFVRMDIQDSTITLSLVAASGYYRCLTDGLNIRNVPSTSGAITGTLTKGQRVQILRTAEVSGKTWGYMNAPAKGWVVMDYLASSDDAYSGGTVTLSVQADNWAKAVKLTHKITIQTTLPTMKLGTTTLKLNKVFPELTGETALSLSQSNVTLADVTVTPKTTEAGKIDVFFENGNLMAEITDGSIKTGTYSYNCVGVLENGDTLKAVTLKITVSATSPKIKLASTTLKLNRYLAGAEQVSTKVTIPAGYTLAGFDGLEGTPLTYADGYLTACLEDESDNGGSYAIYPIVVPDGGEEEVILSTKLTVKVTTYHSSSLSATVTTKGKLDTLNPDSAITCTVKLKNCTGPISGVSLSGQDGDLFHAETNESGNVILTLKEGEDYATNKTYKVNLDMLVCGQTVSKTISFKVTQSTLKLTASPATLTCYQATGRVATTLTVTSPTTAQIADVTLGSKTTAAFRKALGEDGLHFDAETGKLTLALETPALLTPGKSYTVYLDITPQGNATNVKTTQVKLTVKVKN